MRIPEGRYTAESFSKEILPSRGLNYTDDYMDGDLEDCERISTDGYPFLLTDYSTFHQITVREGTGQVRGLCQYKDALLYLVDDCLCCIKNSADYLICQGLDTYKDMEDETLPVEARLDNSISVDMVVFGDYLFVEKCRKVVQLSSDSRIEGKLLDKSVKFYWYREEDNGSVYVFRPLKKDLFFSPSTASSTVRVDDFVNGLHVGRAVSIGYKLVNLTTAEESEYIRKTCRISNILKYDDRILITFDEDIYDPIWASYLPEAGSDRIEIKTIEITSEFPELDGFCAHENRLWGFNNSSREIYASALGDPFVMTQYEGLSTDSYSLRINSVDNFTGCCSTLWGVLFFKPNEIIKITGSYPEQYYMTSHTCPGVAPYAGKSIAVVNDCVYYVSNDGVYRYSGGYASERLTARDRQAYGGSLIGAATQECYALFANGTLYQFSLKNDMLTKREINARFSAMIPAYDGILAGAKGSTEGAEGAGVWRICTVSRSAWSFSKLPWSITFKPFHDDTYRKKTPSKIVFRLSMARGAWMRAQVRKSGGRWEDAGYVTNESGNNPLTTKSEKMVTMRISPGRCDWYQLRLSGEGECQIFSIIRESMIGGAR